MLRTTSTFFGKCCVQSAFKIAAALEIGRDTVVEYLKYLGDAKVLNLLYSDKKKVGKLSKPDKVYLENPNILYALTPTFSPQSTLQHKKKFFSQNLLPLCHQPSETTVFQTYSGGGSKVGGGSKASPTPSPSPKGGGRLRTVSALPGREAPFSTLENTVFSARKRCFHCGEQFWCVI